MTAGEAKRQITSFRDRTTEPIKKALNVAIKALDLLEKKEKAEKVADKLGRLLCDEFDYWNSNEGIKDRKEAQRLLDLQAEGRIIVLPVPIGEKFYEVDKWGEQIIENIIWNIFTLDYIKSIKDEWGEWFFATREEAEKQLEELRNEQGL